MFVCSVSPVSCVCSPLCVCPPVVPLSVAWSRSLGITMKGAAWLAAELEQSETCGLCLKFSLAWLPPSVHRITMWPRASFSSAFPLSSLCVGVCSAFCLSFFFGSLFFLLYFLLCVFLCRASFFFPSLSLCVFALWLQLQAVGSKPKAVKAVLIKAMIIFSPAH